MLLVKKARIRLLTTGLAAAVLLLAAGCPPPSNSSHKGSGKTAATGDEFLLRHKFKADQLLRYDMKLKMNSDGDSRVSDTMRAVIYQHCLGPAAPGSDSKFYRLNITRREIERLRKERDRHGRDLPPVIATRTVEPEITPNYGYDKKRNKNFFPVSTRGMFGLSEKRPFHRVVYDSLVYLSPVLPPAKVRRGSTWSVDVPVYAGPDYIYPMGSYRRGNDFKLRIDGRVDRVYYRAGEAFANISWTSSGVFDTSAYGDRFPPNFHNRQRIIHEVKASGRAVFNVTRGVVEAKNGQATVTFTSRLLMTKKGRGGRITGHKWEETVNRHIIHYQCRLMSDKETDPRPRGR
jgi:hypothetical protein